MAVFSLTAATLRGNFTATDVSEACRKDSQTTPAIWKESTAFLTIRFTQAGEEAMGREGSHDPPPDPPPNPV
jgi:hypothetical protein